MAASLTRWASLHEVFLYNGLGEAIKTQKKHFHAEEETMRNVLMTLGLLAASLTGCAGKPSYSESLQPWIGASADQLSRVWGPPVGDRLDADGKRSYTYLKSQVYSVPLGTLDQRETVRFTCKTAFYFSQDDTIERIDWTGKVCGDGGLPR